MEHNPNKKETHDVRVFRLEHFLSSGNRGSGVDSERKALRVGILIETSANVGRLMLLPNQQNLDVVIAGLLAITLFLKIFQLLESFSSFS